MIEVTTFRLRPDVQVETFLDHNARYQQQFIYQQAGVLRRTVASGLEGDWIAITWWRSMNDARRCQAESSTSNVAATFHSMLDSASLGTVFFKELAG